MYLDHTYFIDGYIRPTHVMIEQKSLGKDLRKAIRQSDGSLLNPFQQAKRYSFELPYAIPEEVMSNLDVGQAILSIRGNKPFYIELDE